MRDGFSSVTIDDAAGGQMVASSCSSAGHERFAFIGEEQRSHHYVSQSEARLAGFRAALAARGRDLPDDAVRTTANRLDAAEAVAGALLDLPRRRQRSSPTTTCWPAVRCGPPGHAGCRCRATSR